MEETQLAYAGVAGQAELIRAQEISAVELTDSVPWCARTISFAM